VKSNIGHLEAASGIAGFIKSCLCLKYNEIPPNIHFHQPNEFITFGSLKVPVKMEKFNENKSETPLI
jgi:acyl transferase domain-containing protein